ncbi:11780_t:CDS:10 [Funneliformis caledonium]|uniref:11780_t:CDS:1 n=1 Tax=Funneliformis caledonium TaxID=1117310 RepID=A0A9N9FBQ5_9GLOM|nr:11780_t:CDS:10 [Funneliformis caledonium]
MTRQIHSCLKISQHSRRIIVLLIFFTIGIFSDNTLTIYEDSLNGPLYPINAITFKDSSILTIRLTNQRCEPGGITRRVFALRSLYPNGTSIHVNLNFGFSEFNFCPTNRISIFTLPDNLLLIRYLKLLDEPPNRVKFMGLITTLDGHIIDPEVELSDQVNLEMIASSPSDIATIVTTHDINSGGLLFVISYDNRSIVWRRFGWDRIGKRLHNMSEGVITLPMLSSVSYRIDAFHTFKTLDGGYGLVYSISSINPTSTSPSFSSSSTHSLVYITLLHESPLTWSSPAIIYASSLANVRISIRSCTQSIDKSLGYTCFIREQNDITLRYFIKIIDFLSIGSIQSFQELPGFEIRSERSGNVVIIYNDVLPLSHGGFVMIGTRQDGFLQGSVYNLVEGEGGNVKKYDRGKDWGIPLMRGILYDVLNNNTLWTAIPGEDGSGRYWYIISNDIEIDIKGDVGYNNKLIINTTPPINATIPINLSTIRINYKDPIVLSTGNISIYQRMYDTSNITELNATTPYTDLLRQSFSASLTDFVSTRISEVEVKILTSTFNQFNSNYYIEIDDNFVRNKEFNEPLIGIKGGTWNVKTNNPDNQQFTDNKNVLLRLDEIGTQYFNNFSSPERNQFFDDLLIAFSQLIPVPLERLHTSKRFQYDSSRDDLLFLPVLIQMRLIATRNKEEMNTEMILKNLWTVYRYEIAGIICTFFVLFVLVFLAHNSYPEGNSMSLFKFIVILIDFIMDILFLFYNVQDVPYLYIPSLVILLAPLSVNFFTAMFVFLVEFLGNNTLFQIFARNNALTTTILLVMGYIDLVSLELLSSRVANIHSLDAPFSDSSAKWIYFGSLIVVILEDIPQLVIQVICNRYYDSSTDSEDNPNEGGGNLGGGNYSGNNSGNNSGNTSTLSGRDYLIGGQQAIQNFNRWWEVGSEGSVVGGSGVGGNGVGGSGTG